MKISKKTYINILAMLLLGSAVLLVYFFVVRNNDIEPPPVVVLLYHDFTDEDNITNGVVQTTAEKFEKDILDLQDAGYFSISLYDYHEKKYDKKKKYFIITFDDGYLTNYDTAFPILKKHNVFADIFINTDNEYMEHHFKFAQAKEMEESGLVKIHSHFPTHIDVTELTDDEFEFQLKKSFDTLETHLGKRKHKFFAYPYSYYNENTYKKATESGVDLQFVQNIHYYGDDLMVRVNVNYASNIVELVEEALMQNS